MEFTEKKEYYGNLIDELTNESIGDSLVIIDFEKEIAVEASIYLINMVENKLILLKKKNVFKLILTTPEIDIHFHFQKFRATSQFENFNPDTIRGTLSELFIINNAPYENFDDISECQAEVFVVLNEINFLENDLLNFKFLVSDNLKERKKTILAHEFKFKNILNGCTFFPWVSTTDSENNHEILLTTYYNIKFIYDTNLKGKSLLEEIRNQIELILRLFNLLTKQEIGYNLITVKYWDSETRKRIEYSKNPEPISKYFQYLGITKDQYLTIIDQMYKKNNFIKRS